MSSDDDDVPAIKVESRRTTRRPVDALAETRFLEALKKTGSLMAAAAAARPHLRSRKSAYEVMMSHAESSPSFAARVRDTLGEVLGQMDEELLERALHGKVTFQKKGIAEDGSEYVAEERREFDNGLLHKLARDLHRRLGSDALMGDNPPKVNVHLHGGPKNVQDVDSLLRELDSDTIRKLQAASQRAQLTDGIEDAEVVEADSALDMGTGGN